MGGLAFFGCSGPSQTVARTRYEDAALNEVALRQLGERALEALHAGEPSRLFFDDLSIHHLLDTESATRAVLMKSRFVHRLDGSLEAMRYNLRNAEFVGVCAQGVYDASRGQHGLRDSAWVVERFFLVSRDPEVGLVGAWVEGLFVLTSDGLLALALTRVEAPRPGHSDLELASCEASVGWGPRSQP